MFDRKIKKISLLSWKITTVTVFLLSGVALLIPHLSPSQTIDELFQQGETAQKADQYPKAEKIWHRIIQQNPNNAEAYHNLGVTLKAQGKLKEAIAVYEKAIEINPNWQILIKNKQKLEQLIQQSQ